MRYVREEFATVGVPLAERNQRMDDSIGALRALWTMQRPHHEGQFVSIDGIDAHPRPVQRPGPPVVVGGESRSMLRRAITAADGWYGFYLDPPTVRNVVDTLRQLADEHERPAELGSLELTVTPSGPINRGTLEQYQESAWSGSCSSRNPTPSPTNDTAPYRSSRSSETSTRLSRSSHHS